MPAPREPFLQPADGTIASSAGFGQPLYDYCSGITTTIGGAPDANAGQPVVVRNARSAFLSFTNALGSATNPGVSPQIGLTGTITPAAGSYLLITSLCTHTNTAAILPLTIGGTTMIQIGDTTTWMLYLTYPIVLSSSMTLVVPTGSVVCGYTVNADPLVTPVAQQVSDTVTYTVPNGKTLWILNSFALTDNGANGQSATLLYAGSTPVLLSSQTGNGNQGNNYSIGALTTQPFGSPVRGYPIPVAAGTVLRNGPTVGALRSILGVLL